MLADVTPSATSILLLLATLDAGWNSQPNIVNKTAGDDYEARNAVKRTLDELHKQGVLERLFVLHSDRPMACFRIDPTTLRALAEAES